MKLALIVVACGLVGFGCGAEPEPEPPAEIETVRLASSLQRRLPSPLAVPADTLIGGSIDALIEERTAALTLTARQPVVKLGANGQRCFEQSFDDAEGREVMKREKCGSDVLRIGKVLYSAAAGGRIDHIADRGAAPFELFDEDRDGKVDRMTESAEQLAPPVALTDFGPDVSITDEGRIASRTREDRDHDGRFELEAITATTSFKVRARVTAPEPAPAP